MQIQQWCAWHEMCSTRDARAVRWQRWNATVVINIFLNSFSNDGLAIRAEISYDQSASIELYFNWIRNYKV